MAGIDTTDRSSSTDTRARGYSTMNAPATADTAPLAPITGAGLSAICTNPAAAPPER